jgi:F-type H+-transporting ATPase subunit epsilon
MAEAELLTLEVATPAGLVLRTECETVAAPSVRGEFAVMPGHLPLLAALKCGLLKYREDGRDRVAAVGPGFVEAEPDKILLLTEMFAKPEDIQSDAVRKELSEAESELSKFEAEGESLADLQRRVDWAYARLEVLEHRER